MFGFNSSPVIDAETRAWMFDVYGWCLQHFNASFFFDHSILVVPDNEFFSGRADSAQGMAELIFNHVKRYAGISHWPTEVRDQSQCALPQPTPALEFNGGLRQAVDEIATKPDNQNSLTIPYNPEQINNPEGLIASFAHITAHYLGQMTQQEPPGGVKFWPQTTEMLAIFLGFGLMFANSAYTFRGGCGSCYNPNANRDAYLTEQQSTYALAIFSTLKGSKVNSVTPHLKKHLRGYFKKAMKELSQNQPQLDQIRKIA